jgi:hypothetical protein
MIKQFLTTKKWKRGYRLDGSTYMVKTSIADESASLIGFKLLRKN